MIVFTIYCHTCTVTGKKYVGQTRKTMGTRWTEHVSAAFSFVGCQALGRAIRKYGRDNWTHTKRLKSALKSHDFTLIGRPEVPAAPNGG